MSENYCYNCRFYHPYYTKGYKFFDKQDIGLCGQTKTTVEKHNGCERFQYMYYGRVSSKNAALEALTDSLNTIAEIKQILEEDETEALEEFLVCRGRQKERERKLKERAQKEQERKK